MKSPVAALALACALAIAAAMTAHAQVPVTSSPNHVQMLFDRNPRLATNKQLVYAFWREVLEAGHMELAPKFLAESYIQHNPNVATGRDAFVEYFSKNVPIKPIEPLVKAPLVAIVADSDYVVLSFASTRKDPRDSTKTYSTTWFDMFRIENGKIAEHWDPDTKE